MYCPQCGNTVEQHFRFCSRCGGDLAPVTVEDRQRQKMETHVNIIAWLFIGSGVLFGIIGMMAIFASQLLSVLPIDWPTDAPFDVSRIAVGIAIIAGMSMVGVAAGIAATGVGLLYYKTWGRVAAIVLAVLMLFHFPLGTAIGAYALWVLLSTPGREYYRARAALAASDQAIVGQA